MKTHLPIALRKALLAAIFAVPVMTHSTAHADDVTNVVTVNEPNSSEAYTYSTGLMSEGSSVRFKDGTVSVTLIEGQTSINSSGKGNINVTNQITGGNGTELTSHGGTIVVGTILGTNTKISNTGDGTVKTSTINGSGTQIETVNGNVTTEYISEKTTIKTQNGDVTTGMINTDDGSVITITTVNGDVTAYKISTKTTITSTGAGNIEITNGIEDTTDYADGEVGTSITSQGGNITIGKTETNGTISVAAVNGENTVISTTGYGTITTGSIVGAGTQITTGNGAVSTGVIYGADTTIKTEDGAVTTVAISAADTKITSTGAGSIKVDGYIREAAEGTKITGAGGAITTSVIAGTNTKITNTGDGTIETGYISGDDTTIDVVNGAVTTGGISGDDTTIDVVNGAVTTGDISGDDTTITSTGAGVIKVNGYIQRTAEGTKITGAGGAITTREIAGTNTEITNTGDGTIETGYISGDDTTINVVNGAVTTGGISGDDTTITSTGAGAIKVNGNIQRTAEGTKITGAGGAITTSVIAGTNTEITNTGDGTIETGNISGADTTIDVVNGAVTTGEISAKTTITSTGAGNIEITGGILDTSDYADGEVGTSIKSQGGNILIGKTGTDGTISVKSVDGENTVISTTGDGTITTGDIVGDGTQITTGNGAVTTGDIFGDDTTITTEDGAVTTGDISGAGTQIKTENGDVTTGEISADTTIISTGSADIKTGDISVANTTLESQGMGDVIVGELEKGADSLSITTKGGSVTIASINIPPLVNDEVDELNITTEGTGGLEIGLSTGALANAELDIAGNIVLGGDTPNQSETIVIRGMENKDGKTDIQAGGSITVNQSAEILPADGRNASGNVNIVAQGDIKFLGNKTKISYEGSEAGVEKAFIKADGDIRFENAGGTTITDGAVLQGGGILLLNEGSSNDIAGDLYADGKVEIEGSFNRIYTNGGDVKIYAGDSITITAIGGAQDYTNTIISNGDFKATRYEVKITGGDVAEVSDSSITSEQSDVEITSGAVWVSGSIVSASNTVGDVTIAGIDDSGIGTALLGTTVTGNNISIGSVDSKTSIGSMSAKSSSLVAQATLEVKGKNVNISGDTSVESENGSVTITATGADDNNELALNVQGGSITAGQDVTLSAAAGTAALTGVEIKGSVTGTNGYVTISGTTDTIVDTTGIEGKVVNIGNTAATGTTKIQGGRAITATEGVNITGAIVDIVDNTAISTTDGNVEIEATNGSASVAGGSVTSTNGVVTISGTTDTTVDTTGIAGKVVNIGNDTATGTTTIQGGQAITATEGVNITGAIVDIVDNTAISTTDGNVGIEATNGSASVAGGSVTSTNGSVTISGTTDTTVKEGVQVQAGTDVTIDGDTTAANTITGADTLVDAAKKVDIYGATNTIKDGADVIAGTDVTLAAATSNFIEAGAVVTAETGEVAITGPTNTIDGAGTTVTGETKVTISGGTANTISGNAQVQAETDAVAIAGGTTAANTITGADTLVDAAKKVDIYGATNTIKDGADVIAGTDVTLAAATSNFIAGTAAVDAGGAITVNAGEDNVISTEAELTALGDVTLTAGDDNYITGADTQLYAGGAVSLNGKNNTITNTATMIGMGIEGVKAVAEANNMITDGGKVFALNDDASVSLTAGVVNQIAGASTVVYAGKDTLMTAETFNVIDDAKLTAKNGSLTMAYAVDNVVALVNSIQNGAEVAAGAAVSMKGAINNIQSDSHVTATDNAELTAVASNYITGVSELTAGTDVTIKGEVNNTIDASTVTAVDGTVSMRNADDTAAGVKNFINDAEVTAGAAVSMKGAINNIQSDSHVTAIGGSVTMTGATQNAISESTVKAGTDVQLNAGENNVIAGASTVTATDNAELTAVASNYITGVSELTAGTDVTIKGEVNNTIDASTVTAVDGTVSMGNANDTAAGVKNFINDAEVIAGAAVSMKGAINNIQSDSHVTAIDGSVTMTGATQNAISESTVKAGAAVSMKGAINNIQSDSHVTAIDGSVTMTGATQNAISESTVKAGTDVTLTGDQSPVNNVITGGIVTVGNDVAMTGKNNTITAASAVNAGNNVTLDAGVNNVVNGGAKVTAKGSVDMDAVANNIISDSDTQVYAVHTVSIEGENNVITKEAKVIGLKGVEITAATTDNTINGGAQVLGYNDDASVSITAESDNLIAGSTSKVYAGKDVTIKGEAANTVYAATVSAKTGDITMSNDAGDTDAVVNTITATAKVTAAGDVSMVGDKNAILAGSTVTAGMDVTLTADTQNAVANSAVTAKHGDITMGDVDGRLAIVENVVTSEAGKTTTLKAGEDVSIMGYNVITAKDKGGTSITAENGNITVTDSNYIKYAVIDAEGDVSITTGTGDKRTWIEDTTISGETVTIAGDTTTTTTYPDRSTENLAVVKGSDTVIYSWGDDNGAGITLNNVSVVDTEKDYSNIKAHGDGDIVILNRVDLGNATLTINDGENSDARIVVDAGNVLNTCEASSLEGRLTETGDINKSGGDELLLDYDHTEFNGTIYANGAVGGADGSVLDGDNAGSWIKITDTNVDDGQKAGVGCGASIVLKNTDLVISTTEARIGTLDTTQDTEQNNAATGDALLADGSYTPTLLADGSYTTDDNLRADFKTVGSVLEVNMEEVGDSVKSSNLKLSDATLIKLNAAVAADGSASSDKIEALGTIDVAARAGLNSTSTAAAPSTARVYIRHNDNDKAATAAEGARTTIMQGTMVTDINEDVLYDVAASGNGTYQRKLQERNVHLENKGDHVDLVYSKNYRSCDKTPQMQQVANALKQISDTFHHHEGTLAASSNRLHNLIDAFDYTRSEGAAQRGLQSVAGTANVLPRLMMFDASRRHLENLREQIQMPDCPDASGKAGTELRSSNAWMTYTGAYDSLNGDAYLDDYTRTGHGIMAGIDHSVRCNLRLGLSLGYEESIGRAENARVDAETFFVDAYAAGVTGRFKHRASIGLATGSYDTERNVLVDAGYHTFVGKGEGSVDSLTVNFGYEISTDIDLNDSSWLTPYAALNLSWHSTDDLRESGMGEAGLVSSYGNEWQSELIFGVSYKHQFSAVPNQAPAMFYANAAMHLELFNDRVVLKNRFIGSPVGWRAESMNREPLYFELGAGVAVPLTPSWTATAGGSVEFGSERSGVSGNVGVRYQF